MKCSGTTGMIHGSQQPPATSHRSFGEPPMPLAAQCKCALMASRTRRSQRARWSSAGTRRLATSSVTASSSATCCPYQCRAQFRRHRPRPHLLRRHRSPQRHYRPDTTSSALVAWCLSAMWCGCACRMTATLCCTATSSPSGELRRELLLADLSLAHAPACGATKEAQGAIPAQRLCSTALHSVCRTCMHRLHATL